MHVKDGGKLRCSGRVSCTCFTSGTSCYFCYKLANKSCIRNRLDCDFDKRNISVVSWHRYFTTV